MPRVLPVMTAVFTSLSCLQSKVDLLSLNLDVPSRLSEAKTHLMLRLSPKAVEMSRPGAQIVQDPLRFL
jgi:hypothetical protein